MWIVAPASILLASMVSVSFLYIYLREINREKKKNTKEGVRKNIIVIDATCVKEESVIFDGYPTYNCLPEWIRRICFTSIPSFS